MNLTDANYHGKNWVDWILDTYWDKTLQPQKCTFWEKEPKKLKKTLQFYVSWLPWTMSLLK